MLLDVVQVGVREQTFDVRTLASYGPLLGTALLIICVALALSAIFYVGVSLVFQRDLRALADLKAQLAVHVARARTGRALVKRASAQ